MPPCITYVIIMPFEFSVIETQKDRVALQTPTKLEIMQWNITTEALIPLATFDLKTLGLDAEHSELIGITHEYVLVVPGGWAYDQSPLLYDIRDISDVKRCVLTTSDTTLPIVNTFC